jgi:hypothetical protein
MTPIQGLAWLYCALFFFVVAITHFPGLTDDQGRNLGLFVIDPVDDFVHTVSFIWAGVAAWRSAWAARFYFRAFGLFYTIDAFVGLITGFSNLEFLVNWSVSPGYVMTDDFFRHFLANAPHFVIGPAALIIGFLLPMRLGRLKRA